jgi:uncharacterized membrane protein
LFLSIGGREFGNDVPLYERMLRARKIDEARAKLRLIARDAEQYPNNIPNGYYYQYQQLQVAMDSLIASALSYEVADPLPDDLFPTPTNITTAPTITEVYPHSIWRDTNTDFTILVKGISDPGDVSNVFIAGISCPPSSIIGYVSTNYTTNIIVNTTSITRTGGGGVVTNVVSSTNCSVATNIVPQGIAITVTLPKIFNSTTNNSTNSVDFVVLLRHEAPAAKTIGLTLQGSPSPEAAVTIARDSNGKLLGINIKPGQNVNEEELLGAIKEVLQKSETPPQTTTILP